MASFGKKIISAFLEIDEKREVDKAGSGADLAGRSVGFETRAAVGSGGETAAGVGSGGEAGVGSGGEAGVGSGDEASIGSSGEAGVGSGGEAGGGGRVDKRFAEHFDKLLSEANIPGPDYYEFARMIAVMQSIPDEAARYNAAFAGLVVQGVTKQRLLETAAGYLKALTADAGQFQATVDASYQEKVRGKEAQADEKAARIQALSQEILQLQERIGSLQEEIRTARDHLAGSSSAYSAESKRRQQAIQRDIDKINQYIH